ncbi:MAG: VWA domain-containing protein [Acidobacteriota bacterium]
MENPGSPSPSALPANWLAFGRLLRQLGMEVGPEAVGSVLEALPLVGLARRSRVRTAARAVLVGRAEEIELFERAFDLFWSPALLPDLGRLELRLRRARRWELAVAGGEKSPSEAPEVAAAMPSASRREALRRRDFASLTESEAAAVRRWLSELPITIAPRRSRRLESWPRGSQVDLRESLRRSRRTAGEVLALARRRRRARPRPVVALVDVSGSMAVYSRLLLCFLYALGGGPRRRTMARVESFVFATRLTHVTRDLRRAHPDEALARAAGRVPDWSGGTRIGEILGEFNRRWSARVLGRGALVLVVSDGWDRGSPEVLRREVARLKRRCHRLWWLTPLLGTPGYQPLTRGLREILPLCDRFLPAHDLASLEDLAELLRQG